MINLATYQLKLNKKYVYFFKPKIKTPPTINIDELLTILTPKEEAILKKLPNNHPEIELYDFDMFSFFLFQHIHHM